MIICDMAGTTINEGGIVYKILYETIKKNNIKIEKNEMKNWYGINKTEVLNHFIERDNKIINKRKMVRNLLEEFKINIQNNYYNANVNLIHPNLPDLFNNFRENDIKIALNSGFSVDIQEHLINELKMNDFIDDYISSEEVRHGRPEPFMIKELMKRNGINNPNEVIKIGDSVNDIKEGINAKCAHSIGVLSGAENEKNLNNAGADIILNSVMDLELASKYLF